jgi:large subunit ribosomal protein L32
VTPPNVVPCPKCGEMTMPHRICASCGHYKGRKVVDKGDEVQA